jgi:hypothetical protein
MPVSHLTDGERPTVINGDFAVVRDLSVQVERGEPYARSAQTVLGRRPHTGRLSPSVRDALSYPVAS